MRKNSKSSVAKQNDAKFYPFQKFEFSKFETINSFKSASENFSADFSFAETGAFEFVIPSPPTDKIFTEFTDFFMKEVAPKVTKGSFFKINFFVSEFDKQFEFAKFNEFFNHFSKNGSTVEFSFISIPQNEFMFGDFEFGGQTFPFDTTNGDHFFFVRQAGLR